MNFFLKFWKKALTLLAVGTTSIFIAACYGPGVAFRTLGYWTVRVRNLSATPIKGLSVTLLQYFNENPKPDTLETIITDSTGTAGFILSTSSKLDTLRFAVGIQDIDDTLNGGHFRDTVVQKDSADSTVVILPQ